VSHPVSGEPGFFSIGVGAVDRARAFYGELFGWHFTEPPAGSGAVIANAGVPGGIHGGDPGASPYLFFAVDDLDGAIGRVQVLGGTVEEAGDGDAASVERFGRFRLCRDDQGSSFGLHERPPQAHDDGTHDDGTRAELTAVVDDWARAIVSNDAGRIASFVADEWVIVSETGVTSKDDFLGFVGSGELSHSAMDRVGELRVRTHGDVAVVAVRMTNTAHFGGRRFDADEWTSDVFVRRSGRWQCVLTQITAVATP
jgi:predicted enzyme related to lactoylglutathione lyase/ketosteroid isomerase-like protein